MNDETFIYVIYFFPKYFFFGICFTEYGNYLMFSIKVRFQLAKYLQYVAIYEN
jgi:hypothetical protein